MLTKVKESPHEGKAGVEAAVAQVLALRMLGNSANIQKLKARDTRRDL